SSEMIRPVAGDCMKPWPLKPVAYRKRLGPSNSPITAFSSGLRSYSPAQPRTTPAVSSTGKRSTIAGIITSTQPSSRSVSRLAGTPGQAVGDRGRVGPALAAAPGGAHQPLEVELRDEAVARLLRAQLLDVEAQPPLHQHVAVERVHQPLRGQQEQVAVLVQPDVHPERLLEALEELDAVTHDLDVRLAGELRPDSAHRAAGRA